MKTLRLLITFCSILPLAVMAGNSPSFGPLSKTNIYLNSGQNQILISNVTDGDDNTQKIDFTAASSDESILKTDSVTYNTGDKIAIIYLKEFNKEGTAELTVTATDADGPITTKTNIDVVQYERNGSRLRFYDLVFWNATIPDETTPSVYDTVISNCEPPIDEYYNATISNNSTRYTTDYTNIPLTVGPGMKGPKWKYFKATMTGYIIPSVSGNYTFSMWTREAGTLYLSPDADISKAVQIATSSSSESNSPAQALVAGKIYAFKVYNNIIEGAGMRLSWTGPGIAKEVIPGGNVLYIYDNVKPSAPGGARVSFSSKEKISVLWNPATDNMAVKGYNIYLNGVKANTELLSIQSFDFDSLTPNTMYSVFITSVDVMGNESVQTKPLNVTTSIDETIPPTPPTALQITQRTGMAVNIKWSGANDAETKVNGYNVFVNGAKYNTDFLLADSLIIRNLMPKTDYNIEIEAIDAAGNISSKSQVFKVTTLVFDPTGLSLGEKRVRLAVQLQNIGWNEGIGVNVDYKNGEMFNDAITNKALKEILPGAIRWGAITANSLSFKDYTGTGKANTYGRVFNLCNQLGSWFALTVGVKNTTDYMTDSTTFTKLMEYLAGPSSTTGGALRTAEGFADPFLNNGKGVIIELGNEVWGAGVHDAEIGGDYVKYARWARMAAKTIKASPYYEPYKDKIIITLSGRNPSPADSWGVNTNALKASTNEFDCLGVAGYLGGNLDYDPKVEKGKTELEYYKYRIEQMTDNINGMKLTLKDDMVKLTGSPKKFYFYESNTTTPYYNGRLGQAMVSVDYYAESEKLGSIVPSIFHLTGGEWRIFQTEDSKPLPMYILAQYYNKYTKGHILKTSYQTNNTLIKGSGPALTSFSPVGIHAYANGTKYSVMLFNRDFESNYMVQLDLPNDFTFTSAAKMYKFTGTDFSTKDMVVDSSDISLTDSMLITIPKHSAILITFEGENKNFTKLPLGYFHHVMVKGIKINTNTGDSIIVKTDMLTLTAALTPDNALYPSVSWSFTKNDIGAKLALGSTNCKVMGDTCNGTVIVRCKLKENTAVFDDIEITITGNSGNCSTGISGKPIGKAAIVVYPNPVHDVLSFTSNQPGPFSARIYDITGRLVIQKNAIRNNINISLIQNGVYFMKVDVNGTSQTIKIEKR